MYIYIVYMYIYILDLQATFFLKQWSTSKAIYNEINSSFLEQQEL